MTARLRKILLVDNQPKFGRNFSAFSFWLCNATIVNLPFTLLILNCKFNQSLVLGQKRWCHQYPLILDRHK